VSQQLSDIKTYRLLALKYERKSACDCVAVPMTYSRDESSHHEEWGDDSDDSGELHFGSKECVLCWEKDCVE
jgi:hypothetical protein